MDWLKRESLRDRQRRCMSRMRGRIVQLRRGDDFGAGYAGLMACGSITCPHCGGKIAAARRDDINEAVELWRAKPGRLVLMGTLTLRHNRRQSFDALADAVSSCWKAATNGRQWRKDRERHGIRGFVRVFETTRSWLNGWHVHVHFLLFVDGAFGVPAGLLDSMFYRWAGKAVALGLDAPLLGVQDMRVVTGRDAAARLSSYFVKDAAGVTHTLDAVQREHVGDEMSSHSSKQGRGPDSLAPMQLLDLAMTGDAYAADLWGEYELGMEGRRTVAWSRGFRDLLGMGAEPDEDEAAAVEDGASEDAVVSFTRDQWRALCQRGLRGRVLEQAAALSAFELFEWLAGEGLGFVIGAVPLNWEPD